MKADKFLVFLVFFLAAMHISFAISVDEFKTISDESEREALIKQAPIEQQEELRKVNKHLILVQTYGGELALKDIKEGYLIKMRGLKALEIVFNDRWNLWESHTAWLETTNEYSDVSSKRTVLIKDKKAMEDHYKNQLAVVHSLVLTLAASRDALELADKAKSIHEEIRRRLETVGSPITHPITISELASFDNSVDQIFDEMKSLPVLTPDEIQDAYKAISETKLR